MFCLYARSGWNSDEVERKGKGCMLQFQHAILRVLTHFVAEQEDPRDPIAYFLGSDWQVDVTRLLRYFIKVEDTRVVRLREGRVLSGRDIGTTTVQVINSTSADINQDIVNYADQVWIKSISSLSRYNYTYTYRFPSFV